MRVPLGAALLLAGVCLPRLPAEAPPVEFGLQQLRQALQEKNLTRLRMRAEIGSGDPESYRITGYTVTGGDLRGLMYGLMAAADQVRTYGRIVPETGKPSVPLRGVRRFLHNADLEKNWYHSREYWLDYIGMLARNRFNRLNLVFAHQTNYLAPPYPYWFAVNEFPQIHVPGLSSARREQNLNTLCFIAQTAADHAIDFTLGVWQHDIQHGRQEPVVEGLAPENLGPYSYQALKKVLAACPAIRSVQVRTNWESGIPPERQIEFYRDYVYRALKEAGRLVTLDLRGWLMSEGMLDAALNAGVSMRLSSKYWAEHLGRPYQPVETYPNYSYISFLRRWSGLGNERIRPYDFFWEIWALGSHRLLLWGDPDYVRRVAGTLTLSDSIGFEIDEPLAQKGYGNRPGEWGIFAGGQQQRKFWKWGFERYWLFYRLWGRLTYDPTAPERVWMDEFKRRFGAAAGDVLDAYRQGSRVLSELVAVHMPDPNMYMWPEINPGGLIDYYIASPPGSRGFVATIPEAAAGGATAKQTPWQTAVKLRDIGARIENAIAAAKEKIAADHTEWLGTEPDLRALALLARFHARRQTAALALARFYETADRSSIAEARTEATVALGIWKDLVALTDGLYPPDMAYGPEDVGHWRDKLPFLEHDLKTIDEREWLLDRFGRFSQGFDFGGPPPERRERIRTSVEPRFVAVDSALAYTSDRGYGWVGTGEREDMSLADASRGTVRATNANPTDLPKNALFGDSIRGRGPQTFRVRTGDGEFQVSLLTADGNATSHVSEARSGVVDIVFPEGEWRFSGVILSSTAADLAPAASIPPEKGTRPTVVHAVPRRVAAGQPLDLALRLTPSAAAATVCLHYRPLNASENIRTIEAPAASATFTIPAEDLSAEWDLLYYFEILNQSGSGWFHPDPEKETPYYVVRPAEGASRSR